MTCRFKSCPRHHFMFMEDERFFVGLKAFIERGGELLILYDDIVGLDFPGGKIQVGENNPESSLKREVKEETGIDITVGRPFVVWQREMTKKHVGEMLLLVGFRCKYLSGDVALSQEHKHFKWINKTNYAEGNKNQEYFEYLEDYFKDG